MTDWVQHAYESHRRVAAAEDERARALVAALDHGVSTRKLAALLGVGHMTVWRWARAASPNKRKDADA